MGRKVQKENRLEKIRIYREKMQEFLSATGVRKNMVEKEISEVLKNINREEFFKAKVEQRKHFEKC